MGSDTHLLRKSAGRAADVVGVLEWYNDLNLVQIYKYLHLMCGGDCELMRHWMQTPNTHLQSKVPANLITTEQGIQDVLDYVLYLSH